MSTLRVPLLTGEREYRLTAKQEQALRALAEGSQHLGETHYWLARKLGVRADIAYDRLRNLAGRHLVAQVEHGRWIVSEAVYEALESPDNGGELR